MDLLKNNMLKLRRNPSNNAKNYRWQGEKLVRKKLQQKHEHAHIAHSALVLGGGPPRSGAKWAKWAYS